MIRKDPGHFFMYYLLRLNTFSKNPEIQTTFFRTPELFYQIDLLFSKFVTLRIQQFESSTTYSLKGSILQN